MRTSSKAQRRRELRRRQLQDTRRTTRFDAPGVDDCRRRAKAAPAAITRGRILGEAINRAPARQRARQHAARRASSPTRAAGARRRARRQRRDPRREADRGARHGAAARRGARQRRAAAADGAHATTRRARRAAPVLGLVGKGITFDTGGISIKPADGMERMKDDMAGGAAVVARDARHRAARRADPRHRRRPGHREHAGRPRDQAGRRPAERRGKTVEVINTDAEGRLILGDGLWYARQLGATHLVDVATLTGAVVVALGKITTGLFGTPDAWVEQVRRGRRPRRRPVWPLPLFDEYREQLKSDIADMINTGGRAGRRDHRGDVPEGVRRRPAVGASRHRRHRLGRRRASRSCRRAPAA